MEEGEEIAGGFVIASCDPSALLEPREQTFDVVAFSIQLPIIRPLNLAVALGRNDGLTSLIVDRLKHLVTVVALVGDDVFRHESLQQRCGLSDVMRLTRRQQKLHRVAQSVAGRVNLRAEATTRPAELLAAAFLRAPAA